MVKDNYDIVKTYGGELKVETKKGNSLSLLFSYHIPHIENALERYNNERNILNLPFKN